MIEVEILWMSKNWLWPQKTVSRIALLICWIWNRNQLLTNKNNQLAIFFFAVLEKPGTSAGKHQLKKLNKDCRGIKKDSGRNSNGQPNEMHSLMSWTWSRKNCLQHNWLIQWCNDVAPTWLARTSFEPSMVHHSPETSTEVNWRLSIVPMRV